MQVYLTILQPDELRFNLEGPGPIRPGPCLRYIGFLFEKLAREPRVNHKILTRFRRRI